MHTTYNLIKTDAAGRKENYMLKRYDVILKNANAEEILQHLFTIDQQEWHSSVYSIVKKEENTGCSHQIEIGIWHEDTRHVNIGKQYLHIKEQLKKLNQL